MCVCVCAFHDLYILKKIYGGGGGEKKDCSMKCGVLDASKYLNLKINNLNYKKKPDLCWIGRKDWDAEKQREGEEPGAGGSEGAAAGRAQQA